MIWVQSIEPFSVSCALGRAVRRSWAGGKSAFFIVCDRHKKKWLESFADFPTTIMTCVCYQLQLLRRNWSFHPRADMGSLSVRGQLVSAMLDRSISLSRSRPQVPRMFNPANMSNFCLCIAAVIRLFI